MGNKNSGYVPYKIPFNLDEESSNYWLGYLCADGNVQYSTKYRVYKASLFSKDRDIVDKFMLFMGTRCKYHLRKQNGIHEAYVSSRDLCEYLISLNIIPNKSLELNPNIKLNRDFIRGYFDGDGCIRSKGVEIKITTGSKVFVNKLKKYIDVLGIYSIIRTKGNTYDLCMERKADAIKFLQHIYTNSTIFLDRKYSKFVALTSNS